MRACRAASIRTGDCVATDLEVKWQQPIGTVKHATSLEKRMADRGSRRFAGRLGRSRSAYLSYVRVSC